MTTKIETYERLGSEFDAAIEAAGVALETAEAIRKRMDRLMTPGEYYGKRIRAAWGKAFNPDRKISASEIKTIRARQAQGKKHTKTEDRQNGNEKNNENRPRTRPANSGGN